MSFQLKSLSRRNLGVKRKVNVHNQQQQMFKTTSSSAR